MTPFNETNPMIGTPDPYCVPETIVNTMPSPFWVLVAAMAGIVAGVLLTYALDELPWDKYVKNRAVNRCDGECQYRVSHTN